jgi:arginine exporter protein ArgO
MNLFEYIFNNILNKRCILYIYFDLSNLFNLEVLSISFFTTEIRIIEYYIFLLALLFISYYGFMYWLSQLNNND